MLKTAEEGAGDVVTVMQHTLDLASDAEAATQQPTRERAGFSTRRSSTTS